MFIDERDVFDETLKNVSDFKIHHIHQTNRNIVSQPRAEEDLCLVFKDVSVKSKVKIVQMKPIQVYCFVALLPLLVST